MRPLRVLLAVLAAMFVIPPVAAQTPQPGEPSFALTNISAYAGKERPLDLALIVTNNGSVPLSDAAITVTIRQRVFTRSELRLALDGSPRGDVLAVTTEELGAPLQPGERTTLHVQRDLATLANIFRSPSGDGVYPISVQLRVAGDTIQERSTAEPFFFDPPPNRLNLVWVLPLHRSAAFDARGAYPEGSIDREVSRGGTLEQIAVALAKHQKMPLTLAPTGLTVDQLSDLGDGYVQRDIGGAATAVRRGAPAAVAARAVLATLRNTLPTSAFEIASATYARADLVGLVRNGMAEEARRQFDLGARRVSEELGVLPETGLYAPPGGVLDAASAAFVAGSGVTTVVLAPETLPQRDSRFGYDFPVLVTGGSGSSLTALVEDAAIRDRLTSEADPVIGVQGALAETAASYFELPAVASQRVLVLDTATRSSEVASRLLDAVASAPWLLMRSASQATSTLEPKDQPIPLPIAPAGDRPPLAAARAARRELATLGKVLGDEAQPAELLDRFILAAESADWISDPQRGSILASAARGTAERTLALVRVPGRQVTLTSRIAQIPVTIINDTAQADGTVLPARVQVKLDSTKVRFPEGSTRMLTVTSHIETVTFRAETRVTGSFPLTVLLETPDGRDTVGEGIIIVRSTAVSAVTLLLTGGGVLVLIFTWARRVLRARKRTTPG